MANSIGVNEMKRHVVIVSIKAKRRNSEMARLLQVVRSFVCVVRKNQNESSGEELVATRKRRQEHCQRSSDRLGGPEFVRSL
ncbi:unnamed protein product [Hymenolepis diminuta]|uniref:Uncharacterized protein n=1 Tax=Hymenolepis diminuta TaxID=6216 RepID=A0A564XWC6_HYMDI|nr:unnamed protein product [Hymenolepis diminuta]VUZ39326.1 unnamed protein product [Hymenolepis diminuta]VUZ50871.1 unnamed protein product [Hymenolepis diminuta]